MNNPLSAPKLDMPNFPMYQESEYEKMLGSYAKSQGPSAQAQYLLGEQQRAGTEAAGAASQRAMSDTRSALSQLAQKGGTSTGMRSRFARQGLEQAAQGGQSIYGQLLGQKAQTLAGDEASKLSTAANLSQLANDRYAAMLQAEAAKRQAQAQYNIATRPGLSNLFGVANLLG